MQMLDSPLMNPSSLGVPMYISFIPFNTPNNQNQHSKSQVPNLRKWNDYGLAFKPPKDFHHIPMSLDLNILLQLQQTIYYDLLHVAKLQEKQKPYNLL